MTVIEVIHTNGLSDIINPASIDGIAEQKSTSYNGNNIDNSLVKSEMHFFTLYSNNTRWVVNEGDKIILSELNMNLAQVDSEISFEDFKSKIKGIILDCQITRL